MKRNKIKHEWTHRVELHRDERGDKRLRIVHRNGRTLIISAEGYKRRADLVAMFKTFLRSLNDGRVTYTEEG